MASSSSSHLQKRKYRGFSGIEPPGIRRKVSESTRLYDVFINHRGPDTKKDLARPLYDSLEKLGIKAFLDEKEMELGVSCTSTIETAIRSAAVHIAIFSETYAKSPWCLEELVLMLRSRAKIIPVFYKVEPWVMRHVEKGAYADAFIEYQNKSRYLEKLEEWKMALQAISFTAGHVIEDLNASDCESIVSAVQKEVQRVQSTEPLWVAKHPVALDKLVHDFERRCLDKHVQDLEIRCGMDEGEEKAKIVGVYGMGGVGKTTLCKELFNRKRLQYNRACFLFDVREASAQSKLPSLQMKLLKDLFGEKELSFQSTEEGSSSIYNRIERSTSLSFLIVIDDIDRLEQLDALPVMHMPGSSLVIITTRDEGILIAEGIEVRYHLKEMNREDARQLFSLHAFSQPHPASGYEVLVDGFVSVCGGLPLSLQVLGRHVHGRNEYYWWSELRKFSRKLHPDIKKVLKISIDALDDEEKQIFIDIACFFVDELQCIAERVWEASGWSGLQTLKDKCLIETDGRPFHLMLNGTDDIEDRRPVLRMHDHLREFAREIANELSYPRRLWRPQELQNLESKGFQNILAQTRGRCFLSFFDESLKSRIRLFLGESDDSAATSTSLLWLQLDVYGYSSDSIPSWIPLQNMQCFRIYNGHFKRLWRQDVQAPSQLRELEISETSLQEFPDFLGILTNAEKEVSEGDHMAAIEGVPLSGSFPTNLHVLDLNDGRKSVTVKAPLRFLEDLVIRQQENIVKIVISGNLCPNLQSLELFSMQNLIEVKFSNCENLERLSVTSNRTKLEELNISACSKLEELSLGRLKRITIEDCNLKSVPGIWGLRMLVELNISGCPMLRGLSLPQLGCLKKVMFNNCSNLESVTGISHLPKLVELSISGCQKLQLELRLVGLNFLKRITVDSSLKVNCFELAGCKNLETVSGANIYFEKIRMVNISDCPELRELPVICGASFLEIITINGCVKLSHLELKDCRMRRLSFNFDLDELSIKRCPMLEELPCFRHVTCLKEIHIFRCGNLQNITLPRALKCLELNGCGELKYLSGIFALKELVELNIRACPKLHELGVAHLSWLEKLAIANLKKVSGIFNLTKLVELEISECRELELELCLSGMSCLKNIAIIESGKMHTITLPTSLTNLTLEACRELETVAGISGLTELLELNIKNAPKLQVDLHLSRLNCLYTISVVENWNMHNMTLPVTLRELRVKKCRKLQRIAGLEDLTELTELYIIECPELEEIPSLARASHFERIKIDSCDKLQNITLPTKLIKLTVQSCRHLQRIAGMDDLTELTELYVRECSELEELPSLAGLSWMESFNINSCDKLQNITLPTKLIKLTVQSCRHLPKIAGMDDLTELYISECSELEELPCLAGVSWMESINIDSCNKLQNITLSTTFNKLFVERCRGLQRIAGMSDLKDVTELCIRDCPELEQLPFICGSSSLERITIDGCRKLNRLQVTGCGILKGVWGNFDLTQLSVWDCPELEELPCFAHLTCLEEIRIFRCGKLQEITLPTTLKLLHLDACTELKKVSEISHLNNLVQLIISQCAKLQEITLPRSLKLLHLDACTELKQVSGISHLNNLVQLIISQCWQLELPWSLESMNSLESITFDECGKRENFLLNKCQNLKRVSVSFDVEDLSIFDCAELEELSVRDCSGLGRLNTIDIKSCDKLEKITLPTTLIKLRVHRCRGLQMVAGIGNLTDMSISECPKLEELPSLARLSCLESINIDSCERLHNITLPTTLIRLRVQNCRKLQRVAEIDYTIMLEYLDISECPKLEELPSLARLSYLKRISIDSCEKLETIAGIEELQALETLKLSFCSYATIQNCIGKLKRVPSAFIQVIGKAAEGAKSNLNPSLLSEAIFCEDEDTLDRTLDDLEGSVSAKILCGVVDGNSSALLRTINKQFNLRQGEWIITAVITDINTVTHYFWQFDYLIKGGKMKGCRWAVMKGEDGGTLHALTTIIDKLHQK